MGLPQTFTLCGAIWVPGFVTCRVKNTVGRFPGWHREGAGPVSNLSSVTSTQLK